MNIYILPEYIIMMSVCTKVEPLFSTVVVLLMLHIKPAYCGIKTDFSHVVCKLLFI